VLEDWVIKPQRHTVVVVGEATMTEGKSKPMLLGFMNVFMKRKGRWQVVASYVAPSAAPSPLPESSDN
jgi:hypothetical protein